MIKALLSVSRMPVAYVLSRAMAVFAGLNGNLAFTNLPVDLREFRRAIDDLSDRMVAALDGGKQAFAERDRQEQVVIEMLWKLARYVEAVSNNNMTTFKSSGFEPVSTTRRQPLPLSEAIRGVKPGPNRGQMTVTIVADPDAFSYELRLATVSDGTISPWTVQPVPKAKPPALVKDLTPGATYLIQVRAMIESGYTDWSDAVTRICT